MKRFLPVSPRMILAASVSLAATFCAGAAPVHLVDEAPVAISEPAPGVILVDFGRVAFGNLRITPPAGAKITLHFGEAFAEGRVNRKPPGSVRYASTEVALEAGKPVVAAPKADQRNTHGAAVLLPPEMGVVLPFRWVEIEGWPGKLHKAQIVPQSSFSKGWKDDAAAFTSSDPMLDQIWELCRYSIKATTFAGIYVDGDRERIAYEADAYINQLSHYASSDDFQMARDTVDRLFEKPTWPTEWAPHVIFMVHADWMHTGDKEWLAARYEKLKTKLLVSRARADGLVTSNDPQVKHDDIVDWPARERDGYKFSPVNTVVNAFHVRALGLMAELAKAVGNETDANVYTAQERVAREAFHKTFFDEKQGAYKDGEGIDHCALHASLFPLAFGIVPADQRARVTSWVAKHDMACSVYAAQYLLEGLFQNGADARALELITAANDRSWRHMVESGTTITWEAWDQKYKPNQDWNHAWGAAPANLLPRFVLGVQPLAPGWKTALIRPCPGKLTSAKGKIPTPRGPVSVEWTNQGVFNLTLALPEGVEARVELPASPKGQGVLLGDKPVSAKRAGDRWILEKPVTGSVKITER